VTRRRPFAREQRTTIVYGMLGFVLIIVILQLWLLTATMNAYLGGDDSVVWPAAIASVPSKSVMMASRSAPFSRRTIDGQTLKRCRVIARGRWRPVRRSGCRPSDRC